MQDEPELLAILERSTRTGIHVVGLRIVTYATGFLGAILIARALGPAGRGRFALPVAVLMILFTLSNLGLEHAQIFLAGQGVSHRSLWANATRVGLKASVVVWAVVGLLLLSPWGSAPDLPLSWVIVTLVQLPLLLHVLYWLNILQLAGKVRSGIAAGAVAAGAETAVVVVMFATHQLTPFRVLVLTGIANALLWAIVLGIGIRAGLVAVHAEPSVFRRGLRFGLKAQVGMVFVFLLFRVDQLMVQHALGFQALGLYSLAVTLAELLWLLSDPFAAALLPHQIDAGGDDDLRLGDAAARLNLLLVAGAALVAWVTCPLMIRLVFGSGYGGAVWPFRLLLPGIVALAIQRPLAGVLLKRGRPGLVTAFGAVALVFNVVWNALLLPVMGIAAASIGSSLAYGFLAVAYVVATRRVTSLPARDLVPTRADLSMLRRALRSAATRSPV